jgi:hypothetical protein
MRAAFLGLPIVFSLAVSCGGRSELPEKVLGKGFRSSCPEPDTADPVAPSLMVGQGSDRQFHVTLHNRCTETIWPAMTSIGGLDQTVPDPSFWTSLWPEESRTVAFHFNSALEIGLFGRTRCSFDEQGQGACETGDCGGFTCQGPFGHVSGDATTFQFSDGEWGFRGFYNVPMRVTSPGCEARQCSFELDACPDASRVVGACGVAACRDVCASAPECCRSSSCAVGADVDITFCP